MPLDPDIFGNAPASSPAVRDADIFKDVPIAKPAAAVAPSAPEQKRRFQFSGDAGAGLDAAEAFGALNRALEHFAYASGQKVSDIASKVLPPEVAAGLGFATNVGIQAAPTLLGGEGAKVASPAFKAAGKSLMQSALKPTLEQLRTGKAAKAIQTMLDEGFNATKGGVEKMQAKIADLADEVKQAIASSPAMIDKNAVASRLNDVLSRYEKTVTPGADINTIQNVWNEFLTHPLLAGKPSMPVQLAQEMKQATNRELGDTAYGIGLKPAAERDAKKALVRGLKEEISQAVPEVAPLNARESALINAADVAGRRALVDANKNPIGLGTLSHNPGLFALWLADRSALAKSLAARSLYSGQSNIPALLGQSVGALYGANYLGDPYQQ